VRNRAKSSTLLYRPPAAAPTSRYGAMAPPCSSYGVATPSPATAPGAKVVLRIPSGRRTALRMYSANGRPDASSTRSWRMAYPPPEYAHRGPGRVLHRYRPAPARLAPQYLLQGRERRVRREPGHGRIRRLDPPRRGPPRAARRPGGRP
jgi:hypothetical protein